ncbi:MAG TPA: lysylphosphatidylglycerol synthase transmembrane domain-containing protein [Candidatus Hydrogenedentes bacterium]|nr:lysylphosphatidylglycerol synthase transmembrane domain-containing protein [Candidatus Hydrogenedentota bacterium]
MNKKRIQIVIGIALAAVLLWWAFRGTDVREMGAAMRDIHWGWLCLSLLGVVVSFFTRILRWRYIVRTAKPVSFRSMFSATQIGFLANFVLPGRAGEVVRALVLGRLEQLPFSKCFAFVALDRLTDLVGLIVVMMVSMITYRPPSVSDLPADFPAWAASLVRPGAIHAATFSACAFLVVLAGAFVLLYVNQGLALRISDACMGLVSKRLVKPMHDLLFHFAEGMQIFRSAADMAKSVFFSLVTWAIFAMTYMSILYAFHLDPPWYSAFVVLSLLALAISLPGAPGFIGQFHAAIVAAMVITMPNINLDVARAIAIVAHLVNLIPVYIVGFYCLYLEGFGLIELKRQTETAEAEAPEKE